LIPRTAQCATTANSTSSGGGGNASCTANTHNSYDHERNKTILTVDVVDALPPLNFL